MERSDYVDVTLEIFRNVMLTNTNLGLCLQSYLRRTENDLESLLPLDPSIRLVKGAYKEPKEVAYPHKREVDEHYFQLSRVLLEARLNGGMARPVIATHDTRMIESVNRMAVELGVGKDDYEFAMLYGIERQEQNRLVGLGHVVRVLISYGSSWFPWYMRRLAERPANVWFVAKQLFR
jgi:proline dehydrogenase